METTVGNQRSTTVGNLLPTASAIRVYYLEAHSTISTSSITFYNGLTSASPASIYMVFGSDSQGNYHESWTDGVYFPDGVWINTGAAGTITMLVGYSTVKA